MKLGVTRSTCTRCCTAPAQFADNSLKTLAEQAYAVWWQHLANMVLACRAPAGRDDFICPDFHAADAAWLAALILGAAWP